MKYFKKKTPGGSRGIFEQMEQGTNTG